MKINAKILNIPPYISTSWEHVVSIQLEKTSGNLIIQLRNGSPISIPGLRGDIIEEVFNAHSEFLEHPSSLTSGGGLGIVMPSQVMIEGLGPLPTVLQHTPEAKDTPPLPPGCNSSSIRRCSASL